MSLRKSPGTAPNPKHPWPPRPRPEAVFLSPVRRIDRLATEERICAITFDDGPCRLPANPDRFRGKALTLVLAETLERYGARGTFCVVGDTSGNYPDRPGRRGAPAWSGAVYDHCPAIQMDDKGGAVHCPDLIARLLAGGHELANHSYSHRPFGPLPGRRGLSGLEAAVADLRKLQDVLERGWGYPMSLATPPRGADLIRGGFTAYDAYALMGYQYLGGSFDGGGRRPPVGYGAEVEAGWRLMERLLLADPDAFRGQIISLRDGLNAARRTPAVDCLERQLRLLTDHGYQVVTASELLRRAPFRDVLPDDPVGKDARRLLGEGWCPVYQDNTLRPDNPLTRGELAMMAFGREIAHRRVALIRSARAPFRDVAPRHPYAAAAVLAVESGAMTAPGGRFQPETPVRPADLQLFCTVRLGRELPPGKWDGVTHGQFFRLAAAPLD